jgi:hypothetical protein
MNWELFLTVVAQWLVSAYVVGSLIQYVKTDWWPDAPSLVWKIAIIVVSVGVAFLWYYDKALPQVLFNALGILVTTFLFYQAILKRLQDVEDKKKQEGQ